MDRASRDVPMYRIQLASGAEAVYRSLEELAVSVQNGIVSPDALVYHSKTGSWLPIEAHPHYHVARELVLPERMRPILVRLDQPANTEPPVAGRRSGPRPGTPAETSDKTSNSTLRPGTPAPLTGSFRRTKPAKRPTVAPTRPSAPRPGNPRKQRPGGSWLMAAAVSGLATVGWLFYAPEAGEPSSPGMVIAGMEAPGPNAPAPSRRAAAEADLSPAADGGTAYSDAYHQARVRFEQSIASLGFEDLFATSRISTADGLRTARRLVAAVRNVVAAYRGEEVRIDQEFGMANASMREPYGTARSVDSLIATADSIYALLQATQGQYQLLRGGRIAFEDPLVTAAYVGQAIWLEARLRAWNRNPARTPMTVRPIVAAVGRMPRSQTGF
ncbi:MAG: hypothetical protein IIA27_14040 [Gemmatimonadetes bacterium]|nr:hypothetical protein [Gemmatimonadota bacterium]